MSSAPSSFRGPLEKQSSACVTPSAGFGERRSDLGVETLAVPMESNAPEGARRKPFFLAGSPDRACAAEETPRASEVSSGEVAMYETLQDVVSDFSKAFRVSCPHLPCPPVSPFPDPSAIAGECGTESERQEHPVRAASTSSAPRPSGVSLPRETSNGDWCPLEIPSLSPGLHPGSLSMRQHASSHAKCSRFAPASRLLPPSDSACGDSSAASVQLEKEAPAVSFRGHAQDPTASVRVEETCVSSYLAPPEPPKRPSDDSPSPERRPEANSPMFSSASSPPSSASLPPSSASAGLPVPRNRCLRCLQEHFLSCPSYGWRPRSPSSRIYAARVKCFAMLDALKRHAPSWAEDELIPTAFHGLMSPYAYHSARVFCCSAADLSAYNEIFGRWLTKVAFAWGAERVPRASGAEDEANQPEARGESSCAASLAEAAFSPCGEAVNSEQSAKPRESGKTPIESPSRGSDSAPCGEGGDEGPGRASPKSSQGRHTNEARDGSRNSEHEADSAALGLTARSEEEEVKEGVGGPWAGQDAGEPITFADLARQLDAELPPFEGDALWTQERIDVRDGADERETEDSPKRPEREESDRGEVEGVRGDASPRSCLLEGEEGEGREEATGGWSLSQFQQAEVHSRLLRFVRQQSKKRQPEPAGMRLQRIHSALVAFLRRYDTDKPSPSLLYSPDSAGVGCAALDGSEGRRPLPEPAEDAGAWSETESKGASRPPRSSSDSLFFFESSHLHFSALRPAILRTFLRTSRLKFLQREESHHAGLPGQPLCLNSRLLRASGWGRLTCGGFRSGALGGRGLGEEGNSEEARGSDERSEEGEPKKRRSRLNLARVLLEEEETTAESEGGSRQDAGGEEGKRMRGRSGRGAPRDDERQERERPRQNHDTCIEFSRAWEQSVDDVLDALDELRSEVEAARSALPTPPPAVSPGDAPEAGADSENPCSASFFSESSSGSAPGLASPHTHSLPLISPTDIARASGLLGRDQFHFPFSSPAVQLPKQFSVAKRDSRVAVACRRVACGSSARRSQITGKRFSDDSRATSFDLASAVLFGDPAVSGPLPKKTRRSFQAPGSVSQAREVREGQGAGSRESGLERGGSLEDLASTTLVEEAVARKKGRDESRHASPACEVGATRGPPGSWSLQVGSQSSLRSSRRVCLRTSDADGESERQMCVAEGGGASVVRAEAGQFLEEKKEKQDHEAAVASGEEVAGVNGTHSGAAESETSKSAARV
ncbi:conserved hypothetical protein [Neospora caninum Liverpool]|uniref:Uncharacterized protein n=1 Tax=Neospora caninum (strain Liverpool) TaxID=572307 RepID=F0VNL2_NEOCL|nr:conserved hypothetical protein [Neospora caninum Liverpool]CBZ55308.1 conserved hypothetical protein [Neospora caninum Liverpool]|eukprot:XP_003885336.1 conserved hypothetical protein [Neospora caninum Liverpool]